MKKITFLLFHFSLTVCSYSQTETINQFDKDRKKDGKWIVYLDGKTWEAMKDSSGAAYYRYTYYDHGTNLYPMGPSGKKNWVLKSTMNSTPQNEKIKLLDGEYTWLDENGKTKFIHVFNKGEYVSYKEFNTSGKLKTYFDYTKKYKGQPHSWYMYLYDKNGNLESESYFKSDESGKWPVTR